MEKQSELVFDRDTTSVVGLGRTIRPSTDAISALENWQVKAPGRSYIELEDDDESYRARLTWNSDDHAAGNDLDDYCNQFGVQRRRATSE